MRWICKCGSVAEERLDFCPVCGQTGFYSPVVQRPGRQIRSTSPAITGAQLMGRRTKRPQWPGAWRTLFPQGLQWPSLVLLWGKPGAGKSTLSLELATAFGGGNVIVLSYEQGLGPQYADLVRRIEVPEAMFAVPDSWTDVENFIRGYQLVVVDSLQASRVDAASWREVTVDQGAGLVLTSEVNLKGDVRGGLAAVHVCDVAIELPEYGKFAVRKNRAGPLHQGAWNHAMPVLQQ